MNIITRQYQFFSITLLMCVVSANVILAQPIPPGLDYALIFPKGADGFAARILREDQDSIIVYDNDFHYLAKKNIDKIILHTEPENRKAFITGSVVGIYAMNFFMARANEQPIGFASAYTYGTNHYSINSFAIIGITGIGILMGGSIGYLFDLGREDLSNRTFIFSGSDQDQNWSDLEDALEKRVKSHKLRFNFSGGSVFTNSMNSYETQLHNAGYTLNPDMVAGNFFGYILGQSDPAGKFNFSRLFSVSYQVANHFELGAAIASLGEPSIVASMDQSSNTKHFAVGVQLDGNGYYGIGSYDIAFGRRQNIELSLTAGIGYANIYLDITGKSSDTSKVILQSNTSIHQRSISTICSAGLSYYFYDILSLGLSANYFYAGKATAGALPRVFLGQQNLTFGNADIGFTLGVHF